MTSKIVDASLGTSNALSFLGVSIGAKLGASVEQDGKSEQQLTKTKIHTPTSLFHKYRRYLIEQDLLIRITNETELNSIAPGYFIEMSASLEENPLTAYFASLLELVTSPVMRLVKLNQEKQNNQGGANRKSNDKLAKEIIPFLQSMIDEKSNDLIAKDVSIEELKVLLATQEKYFMEGWRKDIIDGEFVIIGKVIKIVLNQNESISLAHHGLLKFFHENTKQDLLSSLSGLEETIKLPEPQMSLSSPAMKVYPIAICV